MSIEAWAKIIVALVCAFIGAWGVRQTKELQRMRVKQRRTLLDVKSLYDVETLYCEYYAEKLADALNLAAGITANSTEAERKRAANQVRRIFRAKLRARGDRSPSERATPAAIQQELEKLG